MLKKLKTTQYSELNKSKYSDIFGNWTEFHAFQMGLYFYFEYLYKHNLVEAEKKLDDFIHNIYSEHMANYEFLKLPYDKKYCIMNFIGKLGAIRKLFPKYDFNLSFMDKNPNLKFLFIILSNNDSIDLIFDKFYPIQKTLEHIIGKNII